MVAAITAKGGKAIAVQGDVSKQADLSTLFAETKKAFGRLDVLVNNAGAYEFAPLGEVTEESFHKMFNLNVLGVILTSQETLKYFGSEGESIINIGSNASTLALPTTVAYTATKGALDTVTRVLAVELSLGAILKSCWCRGRRLDASHSLVISGRSHRFWLRMTRAELRASRSQLAAGCGKRRAMSRWVRLRCSLLRLVGS